MAAASTRHAALPILAALLLAAGAAVATEPPQPSQCNSDFDIPNPNVSLLTLLNGYQALAMYGAASGIPSTCLSNAMSNLASCQADLTKVSGCCTQACWDALRSTEIAGDCLNSLVVGTCNMAAANITGAAGLLQALFFTYNSCVNMTRMPYTCSDFWNKPSTGVGCGVGYGGVGYGGVGYGGVGYGGVGYGGVGYGGVGMGTYGGVGYGGVGYGGVGYGGVGCGYGGVGYGGVGYGGVGYGGMGNGMGNGNNGMGGGNGNSNGGMDNGNGNGNDGMGTDMGTGNGGMNNGNGNDGMGGDMGTGNGGMNNGNGNGMGNGGMGNGNGNGNARSALSAVHRRLRSATTMRRKASALASELARLRRHL